MAIKIRMQVVVGLLYGIMIGILLGGGCSCATSWSYLAERDARDNAIDWRHECMRNGGKPVEGVCVREGEK